jgi:hypothetical protein
VGNTEQKIGCSSLVANMESRVMENSANMESRVTENSANTESWVTKNSANIENWVMQDSGGITKTQKHRLQKMSQRELAEKKEEEERDYWFNRLWPMIKRSKHGGKMVSQGGEWQQR